MAELPNYLRSSTVNPPEARAPWYKNTAPSYAGIFLWVGFYLGLAQPEGLPAPLSQASLGVCLLSLAVAGLLCFGLYYYVPALLGMKTGRPLYVVATSTFGAKGGYLMPGLMMGVLQVGWYSVATSVASTFILQGLNTTPEASPVLFVVIALAWAYGLSWVALHGLAYVGKAAQVLNWVPLLMIAAVFFANMDGIGEHQPQEPASWSGFLTIQTIVLGYFATAGAAGTDFGMNARHKKDVTLGGLWGVAGAILLAGALPLAGVAGYVALTGAGDYAYPGAIQSVGALAPVMFFLFAAATIAPTCFCCFVVTTCFSTMLPKIPRAASTLAGVTVAALLAITGVASDLVGFFSIVGASFGPICGAMAADYLLSRGNWSGPREGINWAGYGAWAVGFIVGIVDKLPGVPDRVVAAFQPTTLWAFGVAFVVYGALALLGVRPRVVPGFSEHAVDSVRPAALEPSGVPTS